MAQFRISIPRPCHEDWNKMTPEETGRFCGSCSKTVVDFTQMLPDEVRQYFTQHQNEKICGRFMSTQLNIIDITIPEHILYRKRPFRKAFLLALFAVMGSTLFSCRNDRMLGEPSPVNDTVKTENATATDAPMIQSDTLQRGNDTVAKNDKKCAVKAKKFPMPKIISGDVIIEPADHKPMEALTKESKSTTDTIPKK